MSLRNADSARKVLNSTFLVQEYVEGGNLRKQVLEQVCFFQGSPLHTLSPVVRLSGLETSTSCSRYACGPCL